MPHPIDDELLQHRTLAAELSGGSSAGNVYAAVERVIAARDLRGAVLDFGAGKGNLTRRLAAMDRFAQVSATDIRPKPEGLDGSHGGEVRWIEHDLNEPLEGYDSAFDVVVAAEVIGHLENPRATMRQISRVLRPGGTVIITTPNHESWRSLIALVVRGHYAYFGDDSYPAHITPALRKDLTRIFQETKFSAPEFQFTNEGGFPGKPTITWQQISFGLLRGLRFSDNLIAVANREA